jgi:hypothetical protein
MCCFSTIMATTHEFKAIHSQGRHLRRFVAGVHGECRERYRIETARTPGPRSGPCLPVTHLTGK